MAAARNRADAPIACARTQVERIESSAFDAASFSPYP